MCEVRATTKEERRRRRAERKKEKGKCVAEDGGDSDKVEIIEGAAVDRPEPGEFAHIPVYC